MIGESGTSHTRKIHQYYKCSTAKHKKSCPKKTVQKGWIEDFVVAETVKMLALDKLETAKSDLEVKILQEEMQRPLLTREQVLFWICRYRQLDVTVPEQRQRLIDGFVNAIYLYDGKIILTFHYKEGCKTISFGDIMELSDATAGSDVCAAGAPPPAASNSRRRFFLFSF